MNHNFVIVYGSVRTGRQGIKAVRFFKNILESRGHKVNIVDPLEHQLPLLDKMYKELKDDAPQVMKELSELFRSADAIIVVSAEYNHSIPPALSNILDHFLEEYFWKPSAILTYSVGGFGGVRAAMQLRALLPEIGLPTIPSMFPISKIHESLSDDGKDLTGEYEKRVQRFVEELEWYTSALKNQREKGVPY